MAYRCFGKSGLLVSELAFGTMIFGEPEGRATPPEEAVRLVHRFLEAGGNHIDTAYVYAGGWLEEIVGEALHGQRQGGAGHQGALPYRRALRSWPPAADDSPPQ